MFFYRLEACDNRDILLFLKNVNVVLHGAQQTKVIELLPNLQKTKAEASGEDTAAKEDVKPDAKPFASKVSYLEKKNIYY